MWFKTKPFFTPAQEKSIVEAIKSAELLSTAEIRVHLAPDRRRDVFNRAQKFFVKLGMHKTEDRNGILFYIVPKKKKFVILGDSGIHQKVGDSFWDAISSDLQINFASGSMDIGIINGIQTCGIALKEHFPLTSKSSNPNELPNEISRG